MLRVVLVVLSTVVCQCLAEQQKYDGYQVLRVQPTNELHKQVLTQLSEVAEIDFWRYPEDMMVPPSMLESIKEHLDANNINYGVWIEDVQTKIDQVHSDKPRTEANEFDYSVYHTLNEIMDWIDLILTTYPDFVSKFSIGTSYEGTDLTVMKLGIDTGKEKPAVWIEGTIHAREWISPATVMWMVNQLLNDCTMGDPDVVHIMESYDIFVLTMMNPDGYDHTWNGGRLWRKTRSPNQGSECLGTDGNRNFDFEWGQTPGASPNPCTETYMGDSALSENEVRAVAEFVRAQAEIQTFQMFLDYHSYGQIVGSAWGYTTDLPADYPEMEDYMIVHTDAINAVHGSEYVYGSMTTSYTSGDSIDFAYGDRLIIHSYTVELRDQGQFGFLLPENQIIPCGEENYAGLLAGLLYHL
ncbi:carboxypeptidase B-like [Glandiceps talaboti]